MAADTDSRVARFERERRRRKLVLLALLLLLLAGLGYAAYYFNVNRRLPSLAPPPPEQVIQPPEYLFSITGQGTGKLQDPLGVAYRAGRVYVVDFEKRVVRVYNRDGRYLFEFGSGQLKNPVHMAIDKDGNVWVTDRRLRAILIFDREGKYVRTFAPDGDAEYQWTPLAVGFDDKGRILVTDVGETKKHRIVVFDASGKRLAAVGQTKQVLNDEDSPGSFFFPNGITGAAERIYVSDGDNRRVQVFDPAGKFVQFVSTSGVPRGIALDNADRLYVADALAHQVDIYNTKGEKLVTFGEQGFGPGQFRFPNDIAIDDDGTRIYITDRSNDQVQVWGWPTAEIPEVIRPRSWWQWALCFAPLLLLLLPLLRRHVRIVVTSDFVDALAAAGIIDQMDQSKLVWLVPEDEHPPYIGRVEDGIDLGDLIQPSAYSASDAASIRERLEVDEETSILLAIAQRAKRLATTDLELRKLALLLGIDVYDPDEFGERFGSRKR